jgi:protein TonB
MRACPLLLFLVVASAGAGTVREYRNGEWKTLIIANPRPEYPREARLKGMQGQGYFRIYFGRDGRATRVGVIKSTGHELLDNAAITAFRQWHAKPGVRRELDLPIAYKLGSQPPLPPFQPPSILREFSN